MMKISRRQNSIENVQSGVPEVVLNPIALIVLSLFAVLGTAHAATADTPDPESETGGDVSFDTTFLRTDAAQTTDVARFARGNIVAPGLYWVDIVVNDARIAREDVRFVATAKSDNAQPCFSRTKLQAFGVDLSKAAADAGAKGAQDTQDVAAGPSADAQACVDLTQVVPGSTVEFDFSEQKISVTVPKKYVRNSARGYVPPEMWESGVNAGFVSYNANTYRTDGPGSHSTQEYLGLNAGVNLGAWHFRHQSSVTAASGQATHFDNVATYLQHDVVKLRSQVTLGDAYTTGDVFDSVSFRGAQIATDDRMLPESLRGYAPVVRGTAESNARVTVSQSGQVIYETTVSPGPFEITDLYATGYSGNLDVTVTEADGRTKSFTVPYASVAQSLRPGTTRFAVTAGQLRNEALQTRPVFTQFTLQHGISNLLTLYGGAIASDGYVAADFGAAFNTVVGAFSADVTGASTQVPGHNALRGRTLRIGYSKFINPTDTNITVAAYRYSTAGYMNLSDAAALRDAALHGSDINGVDRERGRVQLTINQNLKGYGSVFVTASTQRYWNRDGRDTFFQAGYSNSFRYGTYNITAGRTRNADGSMSNEVMLSTTIPIGHQQHTPLLTTNLSKNGDVSNLQANLSGTLGSDNQLSYNVYSTYARNTGSGNGNAGVSGTYRAPVVQVTASTSAGAHAAQMSAGVSGSIVAHPGGVTFSQTVGDTFGIVEAKGAEGAHVASVQGVKINRSGYAVVPYLTPYGMNTVDLDTKGTSTDVEFESTSESAVPRSGSVVMLRYKTVTGRAALIQAPRIAGEALPFGADVVDQNGRNVGVVAQDSRIFARGLEDKGTLTVKWGDEPAQQCSVEYALPKESGAADAPYLSVQGHCVDLPGVAP